MRLSLSSPKDCAAIQCHSVRSPNAIKCHKIGAKKTENGELKTAMAIEILPAKDLKKPAEIPVDFTTLIQKAIKFDIRKQKKGKK